MEAMKMKLFVAFLVVMVAASSVQMAAAADAPTQAPAPASDASAFVPTFLASLAALAFGLFFSA